MRICLQSSLPLIFAVLSVAVHADPNAICDGLARVACAPGTFKDPTGSVKSPLELERSRANYADKVRVDLSGKFKKVLDNPDNAYFKDVSLAAFGLKDSPQCNSADKGDFEACRNNLVDGLTSVAEKSVLGALLPMSDSQIVQSAKDLSFVISNDAFTEVLAGVRKNAESELSNPELEAKIRDKIFPQVRQLIADRIEKSSIPEEQKKVMVAKIKSIRFAGSNCGEISGSGGGDQSVASLLIPNAFYSPEKNTFKFCAGFLEQSSSEFQIVGTIGHELSHSIDPCQLGHGPEGYFPGYKEQTGELDKIAEGYPYKNVINCLRDPKSVRARNLMDIDTSSLNSYGSTGYTGGYGVPGGYGGNLYPSPVPLPSPPGMPMPMPGYPGESGNSNPVVPMPPHARAVGRIYAPEKKLSFCQVDQITESFADWMGTEVLPIYIENNYKLTSDQFRQGYANTDRVQCWGNADSLQDDKPDVHPTWMRRIDFILLTNPKVRKQMNCPEKSANAIYCDADTPYLKNGGKPKSQVDLAAPLEDSRGFR